MYRLCRLRRRIRDVMNIIKFGIVSDKKSTRMLNTTNLLLHHTRNKMLNYMTQKKTWTEKLLEDKKPVVKLLELKFADIPANSKMFIGTPGIFDNYIKEISKGQFVSPQTIRKDLAIENGADYTCPVTTGIFLKIVAEASYEQYTQGKPIASITSFWRVIHPNTALAKKLSFSLNFLIGQRQKENISD